MTRRDKTTTRRGPPLPGSTPAPARPYLKVVTSKAGSAYLYYQRGGRRIGLPGPLHSAAFEDAYARTHAAFEATELDREPERVAHTVDGAVTLFLSSAAFRTLKPNSQADYRRVLDRFRAAFGHLQLARLDRAWLNLLRDKYAPDPRSGGDAGRANDRNALRSRMKVVTDTYLDRHPGALPGNAWTEVRHLKTAKSNAHRPWPKPVLLAVVRAATPEFRALLVGYLLTAQRGGDVTRFGPGQYDAQARTLNLSQEKTEEPLLIHVPERLAEAFDRLRGRSAERLFVTPRGVPWTTANAQETLRTLLTNLGLPRFTLHGLRAAGLVALKMLGFENRVLRALSGHTSDANLEVYLRGVSRYPLAHQGQEALAGHYGELLDEAESDSRMGKAAGATGRAAAKRGVVGRARSRRHRG